MIAYDSYDDSNVVDLTVETLIDKLHSLASEGKIDEAKKIARQIKMASTCKKSVFAVD
jgi:soluble cytochrome b562